MILPLLLACALLRDPQGLSRTVEDRLKELDEKLTALEKRQRDLTDENAAMERKIADAKEAREKALRLSAKFWVQSVEKPLGLSQKQAADLEDLSYGWFSEDRVKPADAVRWKAREGALRERVSAEQASQLAREVRGGLEESAGRWIRTFTQAAKLDSEKSAALEKVALGALEFDDGILLPQAHPDQAAPWKRIPAAIESVLPKVSPPLTAAEQSALREAMQSWKVRRP